jgi:hypothetical protein
MSIINRLGTLAHIRDFGEELMRLPDIMGAYQTVNSHVQQWKRSSDGYLYIDIPDFLAAETSLYADQIRQQLNDKLFTVIHSCLYDVLYGPSIVIVRRSASPITIPVGDVRTARLVHYHNNYAMTSWLARKIIMICIPLALLADVPARYCWIIIVVCVMIIYCGRSCKPV